MSPRRPTLAVLVAALALTGCGNDERQPSTASEGAAPRAERAKPAAPLRVGATSARVGDATTASAADGVRELAVPVKRVDAGKLKRRKEKRDGVGAGAACPDTALMPDPSNLPAVEAATLCLLNGERADAGLGALSTNGKLAQSALAHTNDMIANQYFAHSGQDGSDVVARVRRTGYLVADTVWTVGENLAWGTGTLATPSGIVNAWMNSQGHRENILNADYREIGLGVALGNPRSTDGQGATYTTNFGAVDGRAAADTSREVSMRAVAGTRTTSAATRRKVAARCRKTAKRRYRSASRRRAAAAKCRAAAARRRL